jgi:hypothetical protein
MLIENPGYYMVVTSGDVKVDILTVLMTMPVMTKKCLVSWRPLIHENSKTNGKNGWVGCIPYFFGAA